MSASQNKFTAHPPPSLSFTRAAAEFVESVVALRPRLAVFDCDGTLWAGDAGEQFLYWELKRGLLPGPVAASIPSRYRDYREGRVSEEDMCGEMVSIHDGLSSEALFRAGEEFFAEMFVSAIFPEMRQVTDRLRDAGCELWAVSSTNEWVVRAGTRRFGIPDEHMLAACVYSENGSASGRLRRVPTDEAKVAVIRESIGRPVDVAFGNSIHDEAMLALASHAFAINPNPDLTEIAQQRGWHVYFPMGTTAQPAEFEP